MRRRLAGWRIGGDVAGQPELADQAQAVVGERGQMHDRVVGIELARGQALEVQVGLDLGMELLVGPVVRRSAAVPPLHGAPPGKATGQGKQ